METICWFRAGGPSKLRSGLVFQNDHVQLRREHLLGPCCGQTSCHPHLCISFEVPAVTWECVPGWSHAEQGQE